MGIFELLTGDTSAMKYSFNIGNYSFNRPVKDMQPYTTRMVENGMLIVINTLGIRKEDILVEFKEDADGRSLKVSGRTERKDINYTNDINILLGLNFKREVEKVDYSVEDGLTSVLLTFKEIEKSKVKVSVKDSLEFKNLEK